MNKTELIEQIAKNADISNQFSLAHAKEGDFHEQD